MSGRRRRRGLYDSARGDSRDRWSRRSLSRSSRRRGHSRSRRGRGRRQDSESPLRRPRRKSWLSDRRRGRRSTRRRRYSTSLSRSPRRNRRSGRRRRGSSSPSWSPRARRTGSPGRRRDRKSQRRSLSPRRRGRRRSPRRRRGSYTPQRSRSPRRRRDSSRRKRSPRRRVGSNSTGSSRSPRRRGRRKSSGSRSPNRRRTKYYYSRSPRRRSSSENSSEIESPRYRFGNKDMLERELLRLRLMENELFQSREKYKKQHMLPGYYHGNQSYLYHCYCQACRSLELPSKLPEFKGHTYDRLPIKTTRPKHSIKPTLLRANTAESLRMRAGLLRRYHITSPVARRPERFTSLPLNYSWPNMCVNCGNVTPADAFIGPLVEKKDEHNTLEDKDQSSNFSNQRRIKDGDYRAIVEEINEGGDNVADHFEVRTSASSNITSVASSFTIRFDDLKGNLKRLQDCITSRGVSLTVVLPQKVFKDDDCKT